MAVTQNTYTGNGSTQNFAFTFSYLDPTHVKATINGTPTTAFTFFNSSTLRFNTAPASGAAVVIYRETPSDNLLADYTPGSALREVDLELTLQQVLYVAQETQTFAANQSTSGLQAQITTANNNASNALTTANAANTTANGLSASIATANSNASTALTTANNASTTAAGAASNASSALSVANATDVRVSFAERAGFRNAIINPAFTVAERQDGGSGQGWMFDRWFVSATGSTVTTSRPTIAPGTSGLPTTITRSARMVVVSSAGANNYVNISQPIEDVRTFHGETVALSFYAKADSATQISAELAQFFGTGGSPSATVNAIGSTKFSITTSWARYTALISMPTVSGKTIGTNNDSRVDVNFWLDAGSTFNTRTVTLGQGSKSVEITGVQVENNTVVTAFEARDRTTEQTLCLRYFEKMTPTVIAYQQANQVYQNGIPYKVSKRRVPTMSWVTLTATGTGTANVQALDTGYFIHYAVKDGTSGTFQWSCNATADAEL